MPKKTGSLIESASEAIIELILEKKMGPGDKLPNEFDLAQQLGVGRNTVREAIRRLAARNILVIRQGAGTFVADNTGIPEDPLGLTFIGNDPELAMEVNDVRMIIEPVAAELAALNASPQQISRMEELCEQLRQACQKGDSYRAYDLAFHSMVGECSGNSILTKIMYILTESASVSIRIEYDHRRDMVYKEHKMILNAIRRKDSIGAKYAMIAHLSTARQDLVSRVEKPNEQQKADAGT